MNQPVYSTNHNPIQIKNEPLDSQQQYTHAVHQDQHFSNNGQQTDRQPRQNYAENNVQLNANDAYFQNNYDNQSNVQQQFQQQQQFGNHHQLNGAQFDHQQGTSSNHFAYDPAQASYMQANNSMSNFIR